MSDISIFIDTTAVIDSSLKSYREMIKSIISKYKNTISSNYVRMEIKRGPIQYLTALHNMCVTLGKYSLVMEKIQKLSSSFQKNRLSMYLEVLYQFFSKIGQKKPSEFEHMEFDVVIAKMIASYLRIQIKIVWREIDDLANEVGNPMRCFMDITAPRKVGNLLDNFPSQCNGATVECRIREFFKDNELDFKYIVGALENIPEKDRDRETVKRISALKNILRLLPYNRKVSNKEPNYKLCWHCGDAILAISSPRESTILTSNKKHFEPICGSIDRKLFVY